MKEMWAALMRPDWIRWIKAVAKTLLLFATVFVSVITVVILGTEYPKQFIAGLFVLMLIFVFSITVIYFYKRSYDAY